MKRRTLATVLTLLLAGPSLAGETQVYRSENAQGNPVFSDRPEDGGEPVTVKEPNTARPVQPRPRPAPEQSDEQKDIYTITITEPADGEFFPNGLAPTDFSVSVDPPLLPKHTLELLVDGESVSRGASTRYTIPRLTPGAHTLQARILDAENEVLKQAAPVRVTAQWPGTNRRRSPNPPQNP